MCIHHLPPLVSLHLQAALRWEQWCQFCSAVVLGDKCCSPLRSGGVGSVQQWPDIPAPIIIFFFSLFLLFSSTAVGWVRQSQALGASIWYRWRFAWERTCVWKLYSGKVVAQESVGMNAQIDWQAQQISHLVSSLAGQRCSEAWGTFSTWTGQSITALTAWRKEEWRKEAADTPTSKVENDLCSTRQILALFRGQPWGDCWETGRSEYGPFRALRCHLELKLKLLHRDNPTLSAWVSVPSGTMNRNNWRLPGCSGWPGILRATSMLWRTPRRLKTPPSWPLDLQVVSSAHSAGSQSSHAVGLTPPPPPPPPTHTPKKQGFRRTYWLALTYFGRPAKAVVQGVAAVACLQHVEP